MNILPAAQRRLWPELRPALGQGLVLYGGTAIALRLGHRSSVDFDFFTERPLDKEALSAALPFIERSTVIQDQPESLTILTPDEDVKVSFFGMIGFGRVGIPKTTVDGVMQIAAFEDLMATKVKVILQRIETKDYRDIAAMISAGVSLARGLSAARQMYGQSFQPSESLKAMTYFEGGDLQLLTREERQVLIEAASVVRELPKVEIVSRELWAR